MVADRHQDVAGSASQVTLDFERVDTGKKTQIKLIVSRPEFGVAFKLHCFECGPFQEGTGEKRPDGSVVFSYESGGMTCATTFKPEPGGRVLMEIEADGPAEELKKIKFLDGCLQHWESPAFRRRGALSEFASRCFIYTMDGPKGFLEMPRGRQSGFDPGSPWNNPACTQWYVGPDCCHPGDVWSFGTNGMRPVHGLIGAVSRDGKWLTAMGRRYNLSIGQGWHDCYHTGGHTRWYFDDKAGGIRQRTMIYVMPNDKKKLLAAFLKDFPPSKGLKERVTDAQGLRTPRVGSRVGARLKVSARKGGTLAVKPAGRGAPELELSLEAAGGKVGTWERKYWGTCVRKGDAWRMWAHPLGDAVELCVSVLAKDADAREGVSARISGAGWREAKAPDGVPAKVLRSEDGRWTAALFWERSAEGDPLRGALALQEPESDTVSVRGRLRVYRGDPDELMGQWQWAEADWRNAVPYRMPAVEGAPAPRPSGVVTFRPNAEKGERLTYGLTIVPPWTDGGTLHTNFPEHLEYDDPEFREGEYTGYSILRHHDKIDPPWKISSDGLTASYEVESPHLKGVKVEVLVASGGPQAVMWMKITNNSDRVLPRIKPLLCFQYKRLAGFPQSLDDNFKYTYVVMGGKLTRLADIRTQKPDPQAMAAYVKGVKQHDCDKFARGRGGLVTQPMDAAVTAVTSKDGSRKVVVAFTPPKSMLSNAFIPCFHADPVFGSLKPGRSAEASGVIYFTEEDLEPLVKMLVEKEWHRGAGR